MLLDPIYKPFKVLLRVMISSLGMVRNHSE